MIRLMRAGLQSRCASPVRCERTKTALDHSVEEGSPSRGFAVEFALNATACLLDALDDLKDQQGDHAEEEKRGCECQTLILLVIDVQFAEG